MSRNFAVGVDLGATNVKVVGGREGRIFARLFEEIDKKEVRKA